MGTAQISFASFGSPSDRGLLAWRRFAAAARIAHGLPPVLDPGDVARSYWRLHAPNYREIARSATLFRSTAEAHAHVGAIARRTSSCTVHTFVAEAVRSTGWYICLDGEPVVMCARWYQSLVVASQAGSRSLRALTESTELAASRAATPR